MNRGTWQTLVVPLAIVISIALGSCSRNKQPPPQQDQNQGQGRGSTTTPAASSQPAVTMGPVREPAVAGTFYPAEANALSEMIDGFLEKAAPEPVQNLRGILVPHAGYQYSGPTAALAYKLLAGRDVRTAIILAPSHTAVFAGAFLSTAQAYRTPLGDAPLSPKVTELARRSPFATAPLCKVSRPEGWQGLPRTLPALGQDTPETWEHAGEVQVPFLQRVLKDFTIVPVVFGEVDPAAVAKDIQGQLDDKTVVIASSDLSHYHPYEKARALDQQCLTAICALDVEQMKKEEACGQGPILTLMYLAKWNGWRAKLLNYSNSGDTAGGKGSVVGYGAVAFYAPAKVLQNYSAADRKWMLDLARRSLTEAVAKNPPPEVAETDVPKGLLEKRGCFVTLKAGGALRGCIGQIMPQQPLYKAVVEMARSAALHDPRFTPVAAHEVDKLEIEISVLTPPEPLYHKSWQDLLDRLQPHEDGVFLKIGVHSATFLPQVWDETADKGQFLSSLAQKAGCERDAWKTQPVEVYTYRAEAFKEPPR